MSSAEGRAGGHDKTALDEIELTGELMIAASTSAAERLGTEQIDEVLLDRPDQPDHVPDHVPDRPDQAPDQVPDQRSQAPGD
ncbi:hypothetical protein [Kitasatospora sp. NPDC094015]|uniref:hypothetical protein n=1 Tax=Kitasatospora sp. NPDC094015 TaxID=3155205 RepID=UPI00332A6B8B